MGMSNCSGQCELCVNYGHCLAGCGDDEFQLDEEKLKSIKKNLSITYVMPVRRGLRLDQEKEDYKMKFDVKKAEDLLYDSKFHIQDHDNRFQFYGILKSVNPDELTFYIMGREFGSISRGTYAFPAGSNFAMKKLKLDRDKKEWVYATGKIISWEDITEKDESKEEKNMTEWLPCVVSDNTWTVNDDVYKGAHIYRIFNEKFDVKADMTISHLGYYMIGLHLIDADADISEVEIDESMRVCLTSSENDPGTLVMKQKLNFNTELTPGCMYRVVDSALKFKYLMYIRCFTGGYIDADIMKLLIQGNKIKTEHEQLSVIDLKDLMFSKISFTEGCVI